MRGGSLRRYMHDQEGDGLVDDIIKATVAGGWKGLKSGSTTRQSISRAIAGAKRGATRALKRKAGTFVKQQPKRSLTDLFGGR